MTTVEHTHDHEHTHDGAHGHSHDGDHPHDHTHDGAHGHSHALGPTFDGGVVMDIGGDVGGVVLYTSAGLLGREIDIFRRGEDQPLTHTAIRERQAGERTFYAGVYPDLPAGDYTIAAVDGHPPTDVDVVGGTVVEVHAASSADQHTLEPDTGANPWP